MRSFGPKQMTRSANALAFATWLASCSDEALERASAESMARSYGLNPGEATQRIASERIRRRAVYGQLR